MGVNFTLVDLIKRVEFGASVCAVSSKSSQCVNTEEVCFGDVVIGDITLERSCRLHILRDFNETLLHVAICGNKLTASIQRNLVLERLVGDKRLCGLLFDFGRFFNRSPRVLDVFSWNMSLLFVAIRRIVWPVR